MQCRWGFVAAAVAAAAFFAGAWIVTRRRSEPPPPRSAAVPAAVPEGPLSVYQTSRGIVFRARLCDPPPGERPANKRHSVGAVLDISWLPIRFEILTDPPPAVPRAAPAVPVPVHRFLGMRGIGGPEGISVIQDPGDLQQVYQDSRRFEGSQGYPPPAVPDVDFGKHMIIAYHAGHPYVRRDFVVHEVLRSDLEILVRLRGRDEILMRTQEYRPSCLAFVTDQSDLPVRFEIFREAK